MHIINLAIECKTATGDGTKIVCMNGDYVVRINTKDCGSFTNSPVKKLIVRHDKYYYESDIKEVVEDGQTYLQAILPPVERKDYVDLGVCGKEIDSPDVLPTYTSTSARFACDKSVLCGTVVLKADPKLSTLDVTENGKYRATDYSADGFYEVDVQIPAKVEENRIVDLSMSDGNQVVLPAYLSRTMASVTITKPTNLVPENIRSGIDIGGVIGSFEVPYYDGTVIIEDIAHETYDI